MIPVPTDPSFHHVFDAAAWSAGLAGGWLVYRWRPEVARSPFQKKPGYYLSLVIGAIIGAYLAGTLAWAPNAILSLSHSILGALAGAIITVEIYKAAMGVSGSTGGVFVAPFAIGVVIGRWGCLFAGLRDGTYGTPANLPWTVNLGDHIARHPVQIYESLSMLVFLTVYLGGLWANASWALRRGFHVMVVYYAVQRFVWEFLKPYPKLLGPLNLFQLICIGIVIYGCFWIVRRDRRPLSAP